MFTQREKRRKDYGKHHEDFGLILSLATVRRWMQGDCIRLSDWHRLQSPPIDYDSAIAMVNAGLVSTLMLPHKLTERPQRHVRLDPALIDRLGIVAAARCAGWTRPA